MRKRLLDLEDVVTLQSVECGLSQMIEFQGSGTRTKESVQSVRRKGVTYGWRDRDGRNKLGLRPILQSCT